MVEYSSKNYGSGRNYYLQIIPAFRRFARGLIEESKFTYGYIIAHTSSDGLAYISSLHVQPNCRRSGYGSTLINELVKMIKEEHINSENKTRVICVGLGDPADGPDNYVPISMPERIKFYRSLGFMKHSEIIEIPEMHELLGDASAVLNIMYLPLEK